jgi:hypothetical protein
MFWNIHRNDLILSDHEHTILRSRTLKRRKKKMKYWERMNRRRKNKKRRRMKKRRGIKDRRNDRRYEELQYVRCC